MEHVHLLLNNSSKNVPPAGDSSQASGAGVVSQEAGTASLGAGDELATEPVLATAHKKGGWGLLRAEPQIVIDRCCQVNYLRGKKKE